MAFTPEQETQILDIITKGSLAQGAAEKDAKDAKDAAEKLAVKAKADQEASDKTKSLASEAKQQLENEKASGLELSQIENSIKFNTGIKDFIEKYKSLLPDESSKILSAASTKIFKGANDQADAIRKGLLDSYLSQKENIECLTVPMGERVKEYNALTEDEKEKRSRQFWDLVETGIALKAGARKAEALKKVNGGVSAGESSGSIIEDRMLAMANKKFNINNEK